LEIGVRAGALSDPSVYTTLLPRQEVTPVPYALYALHGPGSSGFWSANGNDIYNTNPGNVGIGTSTPAWELEVANLTPGEGAESAVKANDAAGALAAYSSTLDDPYAHYAGRVSLFSDFETGGLDLRADGITSDMRFYTGAPWPANERMRITNTGNVGIGTNTPDTKLHVFGNTTDIGDNTARFENTTIGPNRSHIHYGPNGDWFIRSASSDGNVILQDTGGNVGIGTNSPAEQLHILNTSGDVKAVLESDYSSAQFVADGPGVTGLQLRKDGVLKASIYCSMDALHFYESGMTRMSLKNGNFGIGTVNPGTKLVVNGLTGTTSYNNLKYDTATGNIYYVISSAKYKDDIRPFNDDFNKILKAQPKSFIDKTSGERNIGFIAEEFDELGLDHLVIYKDGKPDALQYELVPLYLLEVVKQHEKSNQKLQNQVDSLTQRLAALEEALKK
ncbi:MAG: tail fiber domain-containing protein, partial [Planctomycetes bacterium]|nr:tail fiber domain-containing protein [Planctomycetota bacterium]